MVCDKDGMDKYEKQIQKILLETERETARISKLTPLELGRFLCDPSPYSGRAPRLPPSVKRQLDELEKKDKHSSAIGRKLEMIAKRGKCKCKCCLHI